MTFQCAAWTARDGRLGAEAQRTGALEEPRPPPSGSRCFRRDQGSGTVLVLAAMAVVFAATIGALMVLSAVLASHRAHSAADLAALAAAETLAKGADQGSACEVGMRLAAVNGASLVGCRAGPDLTVEVSVSVPASMPQIGVATARSRAGPASAPAG